MQKLLLCFITACLLAGCHSIKAPKPHGMAFPINQTTFKDVAK